VVHHNPELYPDPEKFDPERFSPENGAGRHKFAYFPFGGGRRLCIGEGFAWMEGVLVLATIGQKWKFRVDPTHPIVLDPHITLRPKGGLPMSAEPR
jgi:cytochrome P450